MTTNKPRFLDEVVSVATHNETTISAAPPAMARLVRPALLEAEPNAPAELQDTWEPQDLLVPSARAGNLPWALVGIAVLLVSLAGFSAIDFVLNMAHRFLVLGIASGLALSLGVGLVGYGFVGEWRSYRQLKTIDRMRTTLSGNGVPLDNVRMAALGWLARVATALPDADKTIQAIRAATTVTEIHAILRDRAIGPLHQVAQTIGRRAGLQAAGLIAASPHAGWDGMIAGLRGLLILRDIARLFGLRPGIAMTVLLVRKVAWTAAGIAGIDLLSQSLADQALHALPITKHFAEKLPGSGIAALRLYRLATVAADACCPVAK